jgi:cytochrome c oxidase subunit 5b
MSTVQPKPTPPVLEKTIQGFRTPGVVATDYEISSGLERYELLKTLQGQDPWTDLHPIEITKKGTIKEPILVTGVDVERYIGCTGMGFVNKGFLRILIRLCF